MYRYYLDKYIHIIYVHLYVYTHSTHIYVYYVYIYIYIYICVCVCVSAYVCMYFMQAKFDNLLNDMCVYCGTKKPHWN